MGPLWVPRLSRLRCVLYPPLWSASICVYWYAPIAYYISTSHVSYLCFSEWLGGPLVVWTAEAVPTVRLTLPCVCPLWGSCGPPLGPLWVPGGSPVCAVYYCTIVSSASCIIRVDYCLKCGTISRVLYLTCGRVYMRTMSRFLGRVPYGSPVGPLFAPCTIGTISSSAFCLHVRVLVGCVWHLRVSVSSV